TEPQIPSDKPSDDTENHVEQEEPIEDQPDNTNGSQYDSTQEGFPLDEYEEYLEMLDDHESNDEDIVYIHTVRIEENIDNDDSTINTPAIRAIDKPEETTQVYHYRMTQPVGTIMHPKCVNGEDICLAAYVSINGIRVYMLFDSGSTTDAMSPDLARVAELPLPALDKPVTLQLGCSGSRSKVNFATTAMINFQLVHALTFLDIANLDKYDCILGTLFMMKHKIILDLGSHEIIIRGKMCIPAFPEGEGDISVRNGQDTK